MAATLIIKTMHQLLDDTILRPRIKPVNVAFIREAFLKAQFHSVKSVLRNKTDSSCSVADSNSFLSPW